MLSYSGHLFLVIDRCSIYPQKNLHEHRHIIVLELLQKHHTLPEGLLLRLRVVVRKAALMMKKVVCYEIVGVQTESLPQSPVYDPRRYCSTRSWKYPTPLKAHPP